MINRIYFNKLKDQLFQKEISILLGARQVGKSTLLKALQKMAQDQGLNTRYFDLEQSSDLEALSGTHATVVKKLLAGPPLIFLDEFHYLKNASKIFKAVFDANQNIKIYASGSSSIEIHGHLKESLAGRFRTTMIYPLSVDELRQAAKSPLPEYWKWGGMPGLLHCQNETEKMELLQNLVNTYLIKDIKALIREENVRAFNSMLYLLAQNQGSLVSQSSLAREVGVTEPTVAKHLEILAQTYVCHPLASYARNLGNELKKSKKYYLFDLGIRNMLLKDFRALEARADKGVLCESFVFLNLFRNLKPNRELKFWRTKTGDEVDFVWIENREPVPIEVKWQWQERKVPPGLAKFLTQYPDAPYGIIFSNTKSEAIEWDGRPVYCKSFEESENLEF